MWEIALQGHILITAGDALRGLIPKVQLNIEGAGSLVCHGGKKIQSPNSQELSKLVAAPLESSSLSFVTHSPLSHPETPRREWWCGVVTEIIIPVSFSSFTSVALNSTLCCLGPCVPSTGWFQITLRSAQS
jgi:hypothetical protein